MTLQCPPYDLVVPSLSLSWGTASLSTANLHVPAALRSSGARLRRARAGKFPAEGIVLFQRGILVEPASPSRVQRVIPRALFFGWGC